MSCLSTGRKCDGYTEVQRRPRRSCTASGSGERQTSEGLGNVRNLVLKSGAQRPTAVIDPGKVGLSRHECFFLDFFRNVGALDFVGYPLDIFLYGVVRQLGESQPSVKHAAIALTSIAHSRAQFYFGNAREKLTDFVLRQTNKSIMHLLQQPTPRNLLERRAHREVIMTMCGILALLARDQNELETMRMHLMHGQHAMREWQDADFDRSSIAPTLSATLADLNCKTQIASNPASLLQDDNPFLLDAPVLGNFNISNVEYTLAQHWDNWSSLVLDDRIPGRFASHADCPGGILKAHRVTFLFKLRIYARQLKACIEQVGHSAPQSIQDLLTALKLWDQVACAMVAAALTNVEGLSHFRASQVKYDAVWVYFRHINELAKKILQSLVRQSASIPSFPIDTAVGTPLFFCGFYCRDWSTRREALRLLKALEERFKGLDATGFLPMKILALERIIDIESHGLQPGDVVRDTARIQYVEFAAHGGSSNIHFSYRPVGIDGLIEAL